MSSSGSPPPLPGHRIAVCSLRLVLLLANFILKMIRANLAPLLFILAQAAAAEPENIFLMGGQSNMVGHGGMETGNWDGNVPPQCFPDPKISRFDANGAWVEAKEPIHQGIYPRNQRVVGIGPGMPFARHVLDLGPNFGTIGLVPCACDWTSMDDWMPGEGLYKNMIGRAKLASASAGGKIAALLWWQGGKDAYNETKAQAYRGKMEIFLPQVRIDLGLPDLPILLILLPEDGEASFTRIVRNAQLSLTLPGLIKIDLPKLPLPDGKHLNTAGQVIAGTKLADAYCAAGYC